MALSPGIPTSFVPKQPLQQNAKRQMSSGMNIFLIATMVVAGVAVLAAGGTFLYHKYLTSTLASKQAELAEAQNQVDENTIEDFVRLRDRLTSGQDLLNSHVVISPFFDTLESLTLQNVRFSELKLVVAADHTARLEMSGTARNFNALAAQSNAFAGEKRIKRAIFSDITLTDAKLVGFKLTADIDPRLIQEGEAGAPAALQQVPAATTTRPAATTTRTQ